MTTFEHGIDVRPGQPVVGLDFDGVLNVVHGDKVAVDTLPPAKGAVPRQRAGGAGKMPPASMTKRRPRRTP